MQAGVSGNWSLLGVGDGHGVSGRDLEALEGGSRLCRLHLRLKLYKGNVTAARDQTHLLVAGEPGRRGGGGREVRIHVRRSANNYGL